MQSNQQKLVAPLPPRLGHSGALQPSDMTRTFTNPICKETYNSLPKIYGRKKKKPRLLTSPGNDPATRDDRTRTESQHYYSANEGHSRAAGRKASVKQRSVQLSEPKHSYNCSKKNCHCHASADQMNSTKTRAKLTSSKTRRIILPEIRKFELEDLESQHKVLSQGLLTRTNFGGSGLGKIIEENSRIGSAKQAPDASEAMTISKELAELEIPKPSARASLNEMKNRHRLKNKFNSAKFQIQEESEEQNLTDQNQRQNDKKARNESARFKTQVEDSQSPRSSNSISLTSLVFKGIKKQNTNFHHLNVSEKNHAGKLPRVSSQLSNGLFRIPEEPEFREYLLNYKIMGDKFSLRAIIKKPNFKILKTEKEVYFGEVDQQLRKHGLGLNISEKEIFQGTFEANERSVGIERNIDGVYIGGYQNNMRKGHGVFKWNNGEIFEGNWENGMKNGHGTWSSPKGDSYEGHWQNNRQHGQGTFKHRISTYTGQFNNFLKHGKGVEIFANGDRYEGEYREGKPHGSGRYQWSEGGYYEGQFSRGMREGRGKWVDSNGTCFEGSFRQDFKHGWGRETYATGEMYEGEFIDGARTKGKMFDKSHNCIQIHNN